MWVRIPPPVPSHNSLLSWRNWQTHTVENRVVASSSLADSTNICSRDAIWQTSEAQTFRLRGSNPLASTNFRNQFARVAQLEEQEYLLRLKRSVSRFDSEHAYQITCSSGRAAKDRLKLPQGFRRRMQRVAQLVFQTNLREFESLRRHQKFAVALV